MGLSLARFRKPFSTLGAARLLAREGAFCLAAALVLASCSGLPSDGPTTDDIADQSTNAGDNANSRNFPIVEIDSRVIDILKAQPAKRLATAFGNEASNRPEFIKPGDYIVATIWQAGGGGLFSEGAPATATSAPATAPSTTIPEQMIPADGAILVPYVGRVKIAYLTPAEAGRLIQNSLQGKVADPQVLVTISHGLSNQVTVSGDAVKGTLVTLTANENRVLDVIAAAGGATTASNNVQVAIVRNHQVAAAPLDNILRDPGENIQLRPNDTVIVSKTAKFFTALGALNKAAEIPFETDRVSLAQAIGDAGGLLDSRADPVGVFVFRYESRAVAAKLCGRCGAAGNKTVVPIAYRLDMSRANGFFAAQSFEMADRDVIFVSNAQKVELQKLFALIGEITSPILTGAVVTRAATN